MVSRGDFHCHSTASDGVLSPADVVDLAYKQGVRVLALTDHDSTEGVAEARQAAARYPDLTLVPGVEMGTDIPGAEVHMLGLFLDPDNAELQTSLHKLRESRIGRGRGIVEKLREMGLNITWDQVKRIADGGAVGRPHVAQALVDNGHVATVKEAFDKYIARNGPAYVEREKMTPAEAVSSIVRLGGLPCLAHPADLNDLDALLLTLKDAGLAAMEVFYKDYEPATVQRLEAAAKRFDLVPLGGSDYHGIFGQDEPPPGQMRSPLPEESIQAIMALASQRPAGPSR
ncbi:MAG: PHP domain-containing protein [Chloroflexi bacterium]|nr:PHP domain-containing protein [Chloroflexota bacterium]